jgi:hypothetical protein
MDTYGHAYPAGDVELAEKLAEHRERALRGRLRAV